MNKKEKIKFLQNLNNDISDLYYPERFGDGWVSYDYDYSLDLDENVKISFMSELERQISDALGDDKPTFAKLLFFFIDKKKMSDVKCYKKAFVDRRVFSKIKTYRNYCPSKTTIIKFIFALELNIEEAELLYGTAGYKFSNSDLFDVIVSFFIKNKVYNKSFLDEVLQIYNCDPVFYI